MALPVQKLNKTIFLLAEPARYAQRYRDRPQPDCALFIEFSGSGQDRKAALLDIGGHVEKEFAAPCAANKRFDDEDRAVCFDAPEHIVRALSARRGPGREHDALLVLGIVSTLAAQNNAGWQDLMSLIETGRYEASAWFERDRKSLILTDLFTNTEVVVLRDEAVDEAINSGLLRPPRRPWSSDADWLAPLLEYARSQVCLMEPGPLRRSTEPETPSANPVRPRH